MRFAFLTLFLLGGPAGVWAGEPILGDADFTPSRARPVGWRGDLTGRFLGAEPVTEWDGATGRNILWKTSLPNWSNGGCIVVGQRVITLADPHTVLCYDANTGKRLWHNRTDVFDVVHPDPDTARAQRQLWARVEQTYGTGRDCYNRLHLDYLSAAEKTQRATDLTELRAAGVPLTRDGEPDPFAPVWLTQGMVRNPYGSTMGRTQTTPVSDGRWVWVEWGSNSIGCYDLANGQTRWLKFAGPIRTQFKGYCWYGTGCNFTPSPFLVAGKLIVLHNRTLKALDPDTGVKLWELDTDYGAATNTHNGAGTFVPLTLDTTPVVVTPFGWVVRVADGRKLGEVNANMDYCGASPVGDDEHDTVFFMHQLVSGGPNYVGPADCRAIRLKLRDPDAITSEVRWTSRETCDVGSPAYHDGALYFPNGKVLDATNGHLLSAAGAREGFKGGYQSVTLTREHVFALGGTAPALVRQPDGRAGPVVGRFNWGERADLPVRQWRQEAFAAGVIGWIDTEPTHGGWASSLYSNLPFFQGHRIYVRTRAMLYCIGTD